MAYLDLDIDDEPQEDEAPEDFKSFSEETETNHRCPRCGYEWR